MSFNALLIYKCLIIIYPVHLQTIQYATRFRNFTVDSETGSIYLISMNIYQNHLDHYLAFKVNITKDVKVKYAQLTFFKCFYEKGECEYSFKWAVDNKSIKRIFNLKNQFYSPAVESIKPPLNFPVIRKGIYESEAMTLDTPSVMLFYPDAMNYYFQGEAAAFDFAGKKAVILWAEVAFHSFAKRNRNRNRGNSSMRS